MRFLATVVSASEALVLRDIADIIDIKDPSKGPLGAPEPSTVSEVIEALGGHTQVSVALGDAGADVAKSVTMAKTMVNTGADFVKLAIADISHQLAVDTLLAIRDSIPVNVKLVAVAYADAPKNFISPVKLPTIAAASGADGILIDTCMKNGNTLFDICAVSELKAVLDDAEKRGLMTALAGSLDINSLDIVVEIMPNFVGFRSAITTSGDRGSIGVDVEKAGKIKKRILNYSASLGNKISG